MKIKLACLDYSSFFEDDPKMWEKIKIIFRWGVRFGAAGSFAFGIYAIHDFAIPVVKHPLVDFVVTGKSIGPGAYCLDFRDPAQATGEDMHYYFNGHAGFYEAAWKGDHLQVATAGGGNYWGDGYRQLVRDGRVVARSYSNQQIFGGLFLAATLLPAMVFIPIKNKTARQAVWGVAVGCEVFVMGVLLFWGLMIFAITHSTNC